MITSGDISAIAAFAQRNGASEASIATMRKSWPDLHFTQCSDDDIFAARPVHSEADFNLYLVSGAGGCIGFTAQPEAATGVVIATIEEAEEE